MARKTADERRQDPDRALVLRAQEGDRDALGELFLRHAPAVRRLLAGTLGATAELDDLVQDVFVHVHRSLPSFRGDSLFSTWLHQVTIYAAYNHLRRPRRGWTTSDVEVLDAIPDATSGTPHDRLVGQEALRRLHAALDRIKPKKRIAFLLFAAMGFSTQEVSEMVGAPVTTVKSRIWFARRELIRKARQDPYLAAILEDAEEGRHEPG
ncbi:MAG: sigma-70 family RNA polymerase sigma factor [Deltaproteobacteria bacterium]|nr:sigma-70 family RNA polymerase sigma factor [Deltaproteobacteria bacterium]